MFYRNPYRQVTGMIILVSVFIAGSPEICYAGVGVPDYDPVFYYYHSDHLGSSEIMTDREGDLVQHYGYYPFGDERYSDNGDAFSVSNRYTSQILDEDTGLYYYGARYYDAELGRFIQADPIVPGTQNSQAFNRYSYVLNNPLRFVDPTGNNTAEGLFGQGDPMYNGAMSPWGYTIKPYGVSGPPATGPEPPNVVTVTPGFVGASALNSQASGTGTYSGNNGMYIPTGWEYNGYLSPQEEFSIGDNYNLPAVERPWVEYYAWAYWTDQIRGAPEELSIALDHGLLGDMRKLFYTGSLSPSDEAYDAGVDYMALYLWENSPLRGGYFSIGVGKRLGGSLTGSWTMEDAGSLALRARVGPGTATGSSYFQFEPGIKFSSEGKIDDVKQLSFRYQEGHIKVTDGGQVKLGGKLYGPVSGGIIVEPSKFKNLWGQYKKEYEIWKRTH